MNRAKIKQLKSSLYDLYDLKQQAAAEGKLKAYESFCQLISKTLRAVEAEESTR